MLLALLTGLVFGCTTIQNNPIIAKGVIQYGAYELFEASDDSIRSAENVLDISKKLADSSAEAVTVKVLADLARAEVAKKNLTPERQAAADVFITAIKDQIDKRIAANFLSPEDLVTINQVFVWTREAAELYLASREKTMEAARVPALAVSAEQTSVYQAPLWAHWKYGEHWSDSLWDTTSWFSGCDSYASFRAFHSYGLTDAERSAFAQQTAK